MSIDARHQHGLTMIELIIFILVVTIAVIGVLQVIALNTARSADPIRQKQALAIAEGLMNEVRSAGTDPCSITDPNYGLVGAPCTEPDNVGPEGGAARPYDNVNDYVANWNTPSTYNEDLLGARLPAGYAATVTITQPATFAGIPASDTFLITVSVNYGGNANVVLSTYRLRYQ
jgi:MSHA pilin protein MshD